MKLINQFSIHVTKYFSLLCFVLFMTVPILDYAQTDDYTVEPVGQFGGSVHCGDVHGEYAYIGQGTGLSIFKIQNGSISQLSHIDLTKPILDLQAVGNYLYALLESSGGFYVIDISNPATPDTVGSCDLETKWNAGVYVNGNYAYIAAGQGGFQIVDVSNPAAPTIAKTVALFYPDDIFIANSHAYTVTSSTSPAKFRIFDLSNSLDPKYKGQVNIESASKVTLSGNFAYIACSQAHGGDLNGLRIIDVTDPTNPVEQSYFSTADRTYSSVIEGNYAYVGIEDSLLVLNVSDKSAPQKVGDYEIPNAAWSEVKSFFYANSQVYLTVQGEDLPLQILDVSDPSNPQPTANYKTPDAVISLRTGNSHLYISSFDNLLVYDLSNPSSPAFLKAYEEFANLGFLQFENSTLYGISGRGDKLLLLDADAPNNLVQIGEYPAQSSSFGHFAVDQNRAYLQTHDKRLEIADISDPNSPQYMGETNLAGEPRDIALKDTLVFSAYRNSETETGVEIFSVSSPDQPSLLSTLATAGTPNALWIDADTLYVGGNTTDEDYFLQAYLITDPAAPQLLAEASGSGKLWDLEVRNGAILAAVEVGSVIRFVLNAVASVLEQVAECHSPGSLQITTTPPDETGDGTLYTSEGTSWTSPTMALNKKPEPNPVKGAQSTMGMTNYGEYGVAIQKFKTKKPGPIPTLTLLKNSVQYEPICPVWDTCEVEATIAQVTIAVDEVDSWLVATIKFQAFGSGDEVNDVRTAVLYKGGTVLDSAKYTADDGSVTLSINQILQPGEVLHLRLTYKFKPDMLPINKIREFNVKAWIGWLGAEPENSISWEMLPPDPFDNGTQLIAPVKNLQTAEYFANIQDAIDDDDTKDGHTVVACPGIYQENVVVNKSISLASWEGRDFTTIYAADNTKPAVMITANNSSVHGFTVSNGWATPTSGMLVINYQGITISGCKIYANKFEYNYNGLHLSGATNCLVRDNIFENNKYGVVLSNNSSSNTIGGNQSADRNIISGNEIDGIHIVGNGSSFNTIKGNYIGINQDGSTAKGNKQNGIHISAGASDNIIGGKAAQEGNIISGNDSSGVLIEGAGSDRNLVQGNYIGTGTSLRTEIPNKKYGIEISGGAGSTVIGDSLDANAKNYIYHNKTGGLYIGGNGTDNTKVSHNRLFNNVWFGIVMKEDCQQTLLYKNEIIQNNGNGVFIINSDNNQIILNQIKETVKNDAIIGDLEDGHGVKIENGKNNNLNNNVFESNKVSGLVLKNSSENEVYENIFEGNGFAGIEMSGYQTCGKNNIHDNTIRTNYHGITVNDGHAKNRIESNDIYNNEDGIYIFRSDSNIVINNNIHSNDNSAGMGQGIECVGKWNVIGNNQIYKNGGNGIELNYEGSNTVSTNTIYSNGRGILLYETEQNLIDDNDIYNNDDDNGMLLNGSKYNHITNNRVRENMPAGIVVRGGEENVIRNNDIDKTDRSGSTWSRGAIFLDGTDRNIITGNNCHHTIDAEGIFLYNSSENSILKNIIQKNDGDGIQLQKDCWNNLIENNQILSNNKDAGVMGLLAYSGIHFWKSSNYNVVRSNKIWYNCAGIKEENSHDNAFINNSIHLNMCVGTGIHVYGSNSIISGNSITSDQGSAIHCQDGACPKICNNSITDNRGDGIITENGSLPVIYQNNISANDGFGLRNADSSASIYAQSNWWGEAAGPAAGDQVSGLVDFSGWLDRPLDLAVSTSKDTAFANQGSQDSMFCSFRKWAQPLNDVLHVQVTAEDANWLTNTGDFNIALSDSMGADTVICFSVPEYAADGTTNKFLINTTCQSNGAVKKDSFVVIAYLSYLANIEVSPDSLTIKPGQKVKFRADGWDQKNTAFQFTPVWSATSGSIDSTGMFTADSLEEIVFITATDPVSHKFDRAMVQVATGEAVLTRISVSPDSIDLKPGESKDFTAHGYDQFGMEMNTFVQWSATGGTISSSGIYTAGDETGTFTVTATDTSANLSGQAVVIIESPSTVKENPIIPDSYCLHQNYPNPFNPETTIRFDVKERTPVVLKVYDLLGREVKVLVNSVHQPGSFKIIFDAKNFATGVYFYRIQMKDFKDVKKMVLLE